jgi:hypothetical protein
MLVWVFLRRWVPTTRKNREFSHIVRTVLVGFLGHRLLPHKSTFHLHWFVSHRKRSIHSTLGTTVVQISPEQMLMLSFSFGYPFAQFSEYRNQYFCSVYSPGWTYHLPYFIQCTIRRKRVGWRDSGHLAILYTYKGNDVCMYVYICMCVYINIHTPFSRQLEINTTVHQIILQ